MRRIRSDLEHHDELLGELARTGSVALIARAKVLDFPTKVENVSVEQLGFYTLEGALMDQTKPPLEEISKYATKIVWSVIGKVAADLPFEQREEIASEAQLRIVKAYDRLDPNLGWRSFVYENAMGAALDYMKFGRGFEETSIRRKKRRATCGKTRFLERVQLTDDKDNDLSVERVAGAFGVFRDFDDPTDGKIRWALVADLARNDDELHAYAMFLRGHSMEEIAGVFELCPARIGQMLTAFIERFDSPAWATKPIFYQIVFAFGLAQAFDMEDANADELFGFSVGWCNNPVDLDSLAPKNGGSNDAQEALGAVEHSTRPVQAAIVRTFRHRVTQQQPEQLSIFDVG